MSAIPPPVNIQQSPGTLTAFLVLLIEATWTADIGCRQTTKPLPAKSLPIINDSRWCEVQHCEVDRDGEVVRARATKANRCERYIANGETGTWAEYIDMTTKKTARESVHTTNLSTPCTASFFSSFPPRFKVRTFHRPQPYNNASPPAARRSLWDSGKTQGNARFLLFSTSLAKGSALGSRNALGQGFGWSLH